MTQPAVEGKSLARRLAWKMGLALLCLGVALVMLRTWRRLHPLPDGTWERIQNTGVLRIGMDASYPPFADASQNGIPAGLDVDIANEIGRRLKVRVEVINMGVDGLYDALYTRQVDALISALSFDPFRLNDVIYTRHYIDAGQVIVSAGKANYQRMQDLEGRTLAVEYGSTADEVARLWVRRLHTLNVLRLATTAEALDAVRIGQADAALVDYVSAQLYRRAHSGLMISAKTVAPDTYSVVVRLTSYDLAGEINAALEKMAADGTLEAICRRWL